MYQRVMVLAIVAGSCALATAGESSMSDSLPSLMSFGAIVRQVLSSEFLRRARRNGCYGVS